MKTFTVDQIKKLLVDNTAKLKLRKDIACSGGFRYDVVQTVDFDAVLALLSVLEQEADNADCNSTLK